MLSAWLGGLWPGIVTTAISGVAAEYFWIEPVRSFAVTDRSELIGTAVFVGVGVVISALNEAWRRGIDAVVESEARLNVTLGSIGDAVIATDDQGRVTRMNAIATALTGWSEKDALGRPLKDIFVIVNERSREPAENPVYRVLREGSIAGLANHTILLSKDGREIPIDDSAAPIRDENGLMTGVVMVFRDITERRRTEQERTALLEAEQTARRESEASAQQLQTALQAGRMGTWQFTLATGAVQWSPGLEAIHGYAPGTFPRTFDAFQKEIHPEDRDRVLAAIRAAVDEGREHHVEYRIVRTDGETRWVEGAGQVLLDASGQPDRMVGVCADITERAQIAEERAQLLLREQSARAEIERASRLKDEFLAVLSHELRTPLNAVLGYAHLLSSAGLSSERAAHALQAIQRNAKAQARLVESLLDLSRIMAGKLELDTQRLDLATVVDGAVEVIRPDAESKGVTIEIRPPALPVFLNADGGRLQQVFWNLLSNAVKFTPRGGRVAVHWAEQDGQIRIEVSDNGQGISAEFLPYVFERFTQSDRHGGQFREGLGLGLALVREMIQAHGGSVVADSAGEGLGSRFIVTLPVSTGRPDADSEDSSVGAMTLESLPPLAVLIVDDDGDVRDLLSLLLESRGAVASTVSSAAEALDAIRDHRPDVLLADLRMPDEDGYSLIRKLRAREQAESQDRLPAIAVTAYASASAREEALAAGYDWHIAKPVEPEELARAIVRVMRIEDV